MAKDRGTEFRKEAALDYLFIPGISDHKALSLLYKTVAYINNAKTVTGAPPMSTRPIPKSVTQLPSCPQSIQVNTGAEANMAQMFAADTSFEAANACVQIHGGFGFAEK